jgi:hypothetical protein
MQYETQHLLHKLKFRDMERHQEIIALPILEHHPLFTVIEGGIEPWEVVVAVGN